MLATPANARFVGVGLQVLGQINGDFAERLASRSQMRRARDDDFILRCRCS